MGDHESMLYSIKRKKPIRHATWLNEIFKMLKIHISLLMEVYWKILMPFLYHTKWTNSKYEEFLKRTCFFQTEISSVAWTLYTSSRILFFSHSSLEINTMKNCRSQQRFGWDTKIIQELWAAWKRIDLPNYSTETDIRKRRNPHR